MNQFIADQLSLQNELLDRLLEFAELVYPDNKISVKNTITDYFNCWDSNMYIPGKDYFDRETAKWNENKKETVKEDE